MAISTEQKLDFLFKKLLFGKTKSDTQENKSPSNEAIASPLLVRGDRVWKQSSDIPATPPSSNTSVITVYNDDGGNTVETTEDTTSTDNRTWTTGLADWIPTEFGPQYIVKVYIDDPGSSSAETTGTRIFPDGSGGSDSFIFDYQAGVLHFPDSNVPSAITGSKVPYVVGYRYTGEFGVGAASGEDTQFGNLEVSDTTISTVVSGADIVLNPTSGGKVIVDSVEGMLLPDGTTSDRSVTPSAGEIRFNTTNSTVEFYNGEDWKSVGTQTNLSVDTFTGDGSTTDFTLSQETSDAGVIVSINGVLQHDSSYSVTGTTLSMTEPVAQDDTLEARIISTIEHIEYTVDYSDIQNKPNLATETYVDNQIANVDTSISSGDITTALGFTPGMQGQLPVYTVAEANSLSPTPEDGAIAYISNGSAGNPCLSIYSQGNWKVVNLLAGNISAT